MGRPKGSKNKTKKAASSGSRSKKNTYDAPMMGDEVAIIITFAVSAFLLVMPILAVRAQENRLLSHLEAPK